MDKRQRATAARRRRTFGATPGPPPDPQPDDLYATLFEQTQNVLGKTCGFYVATYNGDDDSVRLAYHIDKRSPRLPGSTYDAALCDALRQRHPLINDEFARTISEDVVNSISVPLIHRSVVLGCLGAYSREARVYDTRDARALIAIAELGALALENARLIAEIEKARAESDRLEEIGRAISSSLDLSQVLRRVVDAALEMIGADSATVWLLRDENEVYVAMSSGEIAPPVGLTIPVPPELRRRMADLRKPYFVYDGAIAGTHELPLNMRNLTSARSTMAVALVEDDNLLGALAIGHREPMRYKPGHIQLLERLSFKAASAVANARLHEQIRALSLTDPLTEMPNRRHLDIFLEKEFAAARRGRRLSLLLFDLDHFKEYNDRMGHQAGDAVLRAFARVLIAQTRAMNLAARYGGDEFITILADTDRRGAQAHANRIMRQIDEDDVLASAGVRASVGIASYDADMTSFADLIRAADRDLYLRKGARRSIV